MEITFRLMNSIVLVLLVIRTVGVQSKDLSENDRALRAAFIQKLLNKQKNLEGRIQLLGGPNRYEGKASEAFANILRFSISMVK